MNSRYLDYVRRVKMTGKRLLDFQCPHCAGQVFTLACEPKSIDGPCDDQYEIVTMCPHCDDEFIKVVGVDRADAYPWDQMKAKNQKGSEPNASGNGMRPTGSTSSSP